MIRTATELVAAVTNAAKNYKTLYVSGGIGYPLDARGKARALQNPNNAKRAGKINAASGDTFAFDCVCLIKSLLWGWCGDTGKIYGGAEYCANGVPDIGEDQMIAKCSGVSTDFSGIIPGEVVWMPGHIGVYIGDGLAVECTPAWENKVQITAVGNIGSKPGYHTRTWVKHGKLPYVTYSGIRPESNKPDEKRKEGIIVELMELARGAKGAQVKALQTLLIGYGYAMPRYGADGDFGAETEIALKRYQADHNLDADGICGILTWKSLLGV